MNDMQISIRSVEDVSWILEAAEETMNATEKDFEEIRKKTWYKRLWETVTFSKDNQIKMAKGVGNLAKLQEIMIRILLVLSQNNVDIANAVNENSNLISKLSTVDYLLAGEIEKIKYGGTISIDFPELDRVKKVLIANLLMLADPSAERNDSARKYISSIMLAANMGTVDTTINEDSVERLNHDEQELLYRMIMMDRYLMNIDLDTPSEVVDRITISMKRAKEIRKSVINLASAVTPEFFASYYDNNSKSNLVINADDLLFEEFVEHSEHTYSPEECAEELDENAEHEDIVISSILHIPKGETYRYVNKTVHVCTIIDCEGTLEFHNCNIHYRENEQRSEIKVKETGSISMHYCRIENHAHVEKIFISIENRKVTKFVGCHFVNCCYFLKTNGNFSIDECIIENPGGEFLVSDDINDIPGIISNSSIVYENTSEIMRESRAYKTIISTSNLLFTDNLISDKSSDLSFEEGDDYLTERKKTSSTILRARKIVIQRAQFQNLNIGTIIKGSGEISNSTFENCKEIISSIYNGYLKVSNCTFVKCTHIGTNIEKTKISHCIFNDCYGCLISSGFIGNVNIEFCDFVNWSGKKSKIEESGVFVGAMLKFERAKGKYSYSNSVKNCVFNGLNAYKDFVILGKIIEHIDGYVVYVDNCSFASCWTERNSGKLIREYDHYYGMLKKRKEVKTVLITNCTGLDKVNKGDKNSSVIYL